MNSVASRPSRSARAVDVAPLEVGGERRDVSVEEVLCPPDRVSAFRFARKCRLGEVAVEREVEGVRRRCDLAFVGPLPSSRDRLRLAEKGLELARLASRY
jgi:hypothetical protein